MASRYDRRVTPRTETTLAERKRLLVADELSRSALTLLAERGYDAVTVDEIAAAAGVSKRTFFRYFASKEDVIVRFFADMGAAMHARLAEAPPDEPPSVSLHAAVAAALAPCAGHDDYAERALRVVRLILDTPALRARFLEQQAAWRDDLAAELARRQGLDADATLYPRLAAGTALTAFDTVLYRWSSGDGTADPGELTARAFAVIAPALDAVEV
ncbi:TetR family transcriptional regulator [Embleya sp. NPDC055664]|uniref:TetR family transcriptional regulator n=1 Tax=Embleya sp. NPDC059237 TaxID=3346784 RepID=UPI00367A2045